MRFLTHLFDLPMWQKLVVIIAGALGVAGVGGKLGERSDRDHAVAQHHEDVVQQKVAARDKEVGTGSGRGFVSQSDNDASKAASDKSTAESPAADDTSGFQKLLVEHGPWMRKVGFTFLACFIIGWVFRIFVRMMTTLATLAAVVFFGLSYFGVTNVDLTPVKQKYDSSIAWVNAQGEKAKDALIAHIPASASSAIGFVFGFRKNRR